MNCCNVDKKNHDIPTSCAAGDKTIAPLTNGPKTKCSRTPGLTHEDEEQVSMSAPYLFLVNSATCVQVKPAPLILPFNHEASIPGKKTTKQAVHHYGLTAYELQLNFPDLVCTEITN